ncbi:hypothetical protein BCR34DRAFT_582076 [Clohesyomyces aquaticus]|uniref:Uncharacterized protein n=1 Tax=Clohesyomyces aquaticus TaxID=1231657 RepID=A0A1Y2ABK2_9PLEO|nr:hypothetical protein BCR34DRAFT_582076 [Clohesyomyces aquaticus]
MDSWTGRKRPWEQDSPIDFQSKRRESTATTDERTGPPLPRPAGQSAQDSHSALDQRRLPPPYIPSCSAPEENPPPSSLRATSPAAELGRSRPRSQSIYNVCQQPLQPQHESETGEELHLFKHKPLGCSPASLLISSSSYQRLNQIAETRIALPGALDLERSLPPIGRDTRRPSFGTHPVPYVTGVCCASDCRGKGCSSTRSLIHKLASELIVLDHKVKSMLQKEHNLTRDLPAIDNISTRESLEWALDLLQWNNLRLQTLIDSSNSHSPARSPSQSPIMRRGQYHLDREEPQSPPSQQPSGSHPGYSGFAHPGNIHEDRRGPYGSDRTSMTNSPHHTASPSGSMFMPPQSPMHAPQLSRSGMLPSPSSMGFPGVPNLPPISPPASTIQSSAQAAHLQDLQHQVSIKTLAFQTLQHEYDNLLQKLERQRTKCATLEKKFEVSDVEINSLTDEKEKLQSQVTTLEIQVEELQQGRDEARRQLVANGAQYMRIMEMANRLQTQSAEDKKRWAAERMDLEQRIRILEEAMVTGTDRPATQREQSSASDYMGSITMEHATGPSSTAIPSSAETVNVLRGEIGRLRSRTQTLERALQTMREESISIQAAARQLVLASGNIEKAAQDATG